MKDLIIIGAGPAGLTASIYAIRAGLDVLLIEKLSPGGQVVNTFEVENYPGFENPIAGWDLVSGMEKQVRRLGVEIATGEIKSLEKDNDKNIFIMTKSDGTQLEAKSVIAATGSSYRKIGIPGEKEFTGKGVSYCATCDGAFFKDKAVAVIGGGDTALEEAHFMTRFATKVYLIHRRDEFRGSKILQDRILSESKIEPVYDTIPEKINGSQTIESISVMNKKTEKKWDIDVNGVFIFVGFSPNTGYIAKELLNDRGEVIVNEEMETEIKGLYAAGDMRSNSKRQIVTGASDGAVAALNVYDYLLDLPTL